MKTEIPGDKEKFKIKAIRNMLATLVMMRPATPAVSQGKKPVVVLARDLNSLRNVVDDAVSNFICPGSNDQLCFVGLAPRHLNLIQDRRYRDWIISTSFLVGLEGNGPPILAKDGQHIAVLAHVTSRPQPPMSPASQLPETAWDLAEQAETVRQRMIQRQLKQQRLEDEEAAYQERMSSTSEVSEPDSEEDATQPMPGSPHEPPQKKAKA